MDFSVRAAESSDADALADLHVRTWREAYSHLLPDDFFTAEYTRGRHEMWDKVLTNRSDRWTVRVAERDGVILGFSWSGRPMGPEEHEFPDHQQLYAIYISATAYGSGVAQALIDAALGDGPTVLWVAKENPRAVAFYRRNGFEFDGTEKLDPAAPAITDARMVRPAPPQTGQGYR
jgi:ribosomal protein S18 acetylase RimI-like enzyme